MRSPWKAHVKQSSSPQIVCGCVFLITLLTSFLSWPAWAQRQKAQEPKILYVPRDIEGAVPDPDNEGKEKDKFKDQKITAQAMVRSDILMADGILALNAGALDVAELQFKKALRVNFKNYVAFEYLAILEEKRGQLGRAIGWLLKGLSYVPIARRPALHFHLGRLYYEYGRTYQKNKLENKVYFANKRKYKKIGEDYALKALKKGVFPIQSRYLVGYMAYKNDELEKAEKLFREALVLSLAEDVSEGEVESRQALNYYLGELYTRLGYENFAVSAFQKVERGGSWELRTQAWKNHADLNRLLVQFDIAGMAQFDTHVVRLPLHNNSPVAVSEDSSPKAIFSGDLQVRSGLSRPWVYGFGAFFEMARHVEEDLKTFNLSHFSGKIFGRYWNRKDWQIELQYAPERMWIKVFSPFQTLHTIKLFGTYTPYQRWYWRVGGLYSLNSHEELATAGDDTRSGNIYSGFFQFGIDSPNPVIQPQFEYSFTQDQAEGANFVSSAHLFSAQFKIKLSEQVEWIPHFGLVVTNFPNHLSGRTDVYTKIGTEVDYSLYRHFVLFTAFEKGYNQSTLSEFAYHRLTATGGFRYRF